MLHKALNKFPAGTGKRWEVVQGYVRTRTVEEILDMVKHGLKAGGWLPHVGAAGGWLPHVGAASCGWLPHVGAAGGCCRVWVLPRVGARHRKQENAGMWVLVPGFENRRALANATVGCDGC
jgi:hypothetical protein